jgi:hypothetical protein
MGDRLSAAVGDPQIAAVRAWWRVRRPGPPLGKRLDTLYMVAITTGILGALLYSTASSALGSWLTPTTMPEWGPAVALVALVAVARWGTWQGPVVYAAPDVGFLLGAPLGRRALAMRPLARALGASAGVGAVVAAVALVGLAGDGRGIDAGPAAGLVAGVALIGVLGVAGAARVQCSARWSRAIAIAFPASVALGAGLVAVASAGDTGRQVVLWSGPWGWAVQPVAGATTAASLLALGLLVVAAIVAVAAAARGFEPCATERHAVRAEARSGAVASAWALDARTARLSLRRAAGPSRTRARRRLRAPRRPELAVPWRDATAALRAPQRTLGCAALALAAACVAIAAADRPAAEALAALGAYVAASIMLEPLRQDVDQPSASRVLLRRPFGRILLGHVAVPMAVLAAGAAVAGLALAAAGELPARGGAIALAAVAIVPTVVLCAALSSRRGGRVPVSVLAMGSAADPSGGGIVIAWVLAWPVAAVVLGALPLVYLARGASVGSAVGLAVAVAVAAPAALGTALAASES